MAKGMDNYLMLTVVGALIAQDGGNGIKSSQIEDSRLMTVLAEQFAFNNWLERTTAAIRNLPLELQNSEGPVRVVTCLSEWQ